MTETNIEAIASARMDGIAAAMNVPQVERCPFAEYSDLDRSTSIDIAAAILNPLTEAFWPVDAHNLFLALAPADHRDAMPYEQLSGCSHTLEEEGLRAAIDAAIALDPENERLLQLRRNLAIGIVVEAMMDTAARELSMSDVSAAQIWGNLAERAMTAFAIQLFEAGDDADAVLDMTDTVRSNALARIANTLNRKPAVH